MRSDRSQSTSWINFPIVPPLGRSMPMSTRPVLLGRMTGVNSGNSKKEEDQPGQDEGVDIEGLPNQAVGQENDEGRPSWTWRGFQGFIALLVVIFSTWLALALGSRESWVYHTNLSVKVPICNSSYNWGGAGRCIETDWIEKGLATDPSFYALIVSTDLAGLAAMWLYLIAPNKSKVPATPKSLAASLISPSCRGFPWGKIFCTRTENLAPWEASARWAAMREDCCTSVCALLCFRSRLEHWVKPSAAKHLNTNPRSHTFCASTGWKAWYH